MLLTLLGTGDTKVRATLNRRLAFAYPFLFPRFEPSSEGRETPVEHFAWLYAGEQAFLAGIEKAGQGKYHLLGTVAQEGVSDSFMAIVPLYVDLGDGKYGLFGRAPCRGTRRPACPRRRRSRASRRRRMSRRDARTRGST